MSRTDERLASFTIGYAFAMLAYNTYVMDPDSLESNEHVEPDWWKGPDEGWPVTAFEEGSREALEADCLDFFKANLRALMGYAAVIRSRLPEDVGLAVADERAYRGAGMDFALTRNGHGAGFWDRGMPEEIGGPLTAASKVYGESQAWLSGDATKVSIQV